ncbi:hypothetical protein NDU88_002894 [Pleurodeles waltl]|uniref:Myb/SANT-like DNA-binding domain-containing protein n=1 Tax=Pleurodeles waltl TaxID=8319 RepID=A0AAV7V083_PLEWA|nr:hypothetical protein NDU88_002894 [Pleurodeles waltl]
MVEEIIRVEPQLFGSQVQQISIARKMELWWRIVDRVNAVGQHPRTRDDIRKRWNDLRGKVPHPISPERKCQQHPVPPPEEAHSDDSSSGRLDLDDQPGPSGISRQSVTQAQSHTTTESPPLGNTTTEPTQWAHTSVPSTRYSAVCPPLQGPQATPQTQDDQGPRVSGSRRTVQGTEAQDNREAGRAAVRQREDRPREPTLQEALINILGAYHHYQETMGQILAKLQETQWLQDGQYLGIREDLRDIHTTLVTIAGVLADMANTMRETVAHHRAPDTSQNDEQTSTSAAISGQEALPQEQQATSTPPPAEGEPPHKQSLWSRQKTENIAKTPARK